MHGAGSPQAQRIMIARQSNMDHKKELAKDTGRRRQAVGPQKAKLRKPAASQVTGCRTESCRAAVRIVFCGGCNPLIDRVALAAELQGRP